MFKHILFPCDLSDASLDAFAYVKEVARAFGAKVTLFHAYEVFSPALASLYEISYSAPLQNLAEAIEEKSQQQLKTYQHELTQADVPNELFVLQGKAGPLIVQAAQDKQADLIIMGSRGLGPMSSVLLGSTSTYVLHHCKLPMLVVPLQSE